MSARVSKPVAKVLGGIAVLFGIATLVSGGNALFVSHEIANPAANIVPFVLYFNFAAGFAYVAAGAGLVLQRPWAPALSAAIAAATAIVFAGLGVWILAGNAYEMRTVAAMSLRTVFWLVAGAVSMMRSGSPDHPASRHPASHRPASGHLASGGQADVRQAGDSRSPNGDDGRNAP